MRIELSATPNWLKISWPIYDEAIEAEILRRLSNVPGALGFGQRWYAPVSQLWQLTRLFDKASYQYEAMCAADAAERLVEATIPYQPTPEDEAELGPLFRGIQNAKRKVDKEIKYPRRRRAKKSKQGEL